MGTTYSSQTGPESFYSWVPDSSNVGDSYNNYKRAIKTPHTLRTVLNISHCGPVLDQGKLGSCTANSLAGLYTYRYNMEKGIVTNAEDYDPTDEFLPSRLFIYYNERNMEGTTKTDSGAEIKDGITTLKKLGVCSESMWPYDISKFTDKPSTECYTDAITHHKSLKQHRVVKTLDSLKGCLDMGEVFSFGFVVFESFENSAKWNGAIMPMPEGGEKILGGHAVLCIGYDDNKQAFIVRNSWGKSWGDNGNFYMPYEFMIGTFNTCDFNVSTETYWKIVHEKHMESKSEEDNSSGTDMAYASDFWTIDLTMDKAESTEEST